MVMVPEPPKVAYLNSLVNFSYQKEALRQQAQVEIFWN
jgi:hypothetical protein